MTEQIPEIQEPTDSTDNVSMSANPKPAKAPWYLGGTFVAVVAFVLGVVLANSMNSGTRADLASVTAERDDLKSQVTAVSAERDALQKQIQAESSTSSQPAPTTAAAPAPAAPEPAPVPTTFSDGTYLVGTDLPAGRYKGTPVGGTAYWQISSDANGDKILSNDNADGQFYIQVKKEQYLEIERAEIKKVK